MVGEEDSSEDWGRVEIASVPAAARGFRTKPGLLVAA